MFEVYDRLSHNVLGSFDTELEAITFIETYIPDKYIERLSLEERTIDSTRILLGKEIKKRIEKNGK